MNFFLKYRFSIFQAGNSAKQKRAWNAEINNSYLNPTLNILGFLIASKVSYYNTLTPQFSEIGPFKLTENCENENYELCSNWAGKNRKLRGLLGCLDRKLRGMSMIWNTENCENENYGGENCGVMVYIYQSNLASCAL